ncbi:MAG: SPOR domain-containing protein [Candidatus Neomarinimicrobiota bacterium]
MKVKVFIYFFPYLLLSQNIDMYLNLIDEGQKEGVKENLPELLSKYPNNPGVIYLQALLTVDGMKSLEIYSILIKKFPKSKYGGEASAKIGEYLFARGLYSQAARQLCTVPRKYPRLLNMQGIIDMVVSSFRAIGEEDSVKYYAGIYQSMFPSLDFEKYEIKISPPKINQTIINKNNKQIEPYIIQIGAFGSIHNANRLKLQVSQIGYNVEITPVKTNGRNLHTVRVVRYKSKNSAQRVGDIIKRKLGIDYRVLYRPEN